MASQRVSSHQLTSIIVIHFLTILIYIVGTAEEFVERRNTRQKWFKQRTTFVNCENRHQIG
jgi:hypothetical protein